MRWLTPVTQEGISPQPSSRTHARTSKQQGTSPKGAVYPSLGRKPQVRDITTDQALKARHISAAQVRYTGLSALDSLLRHGPEGLGFNRAVKAGPKARTLLPQAGVEA